MKHVTGRRGPRRRMRMLLLVLLSVGLGAVPAAAAAAPAHGDCSTTSVAAGSGGAAWVPLVEQGLAWLCPHFGPLNAAIDVSVGPNNQGGPWPWAETTPLGPGGSESDPLTSCSIRIENLAGVSDTSAQMATITHELFHCYQAQIMGIGRYVQALAAAPRDVRGSGWLIDGSAEWVGECSVGDCTTQGSLISSPWWDMYLSTPQTPLFQRSYDAIGFYAHMQERGISPFDRLPMMLMAADSAAAFAQAQLDDVSLETWAGGYARMSSWGAGVWDTTGPGVTGTSPTVATTQLGNGAGTTDDIDAYSNYLGTYTLTADIVTIAVGSDGHGQLRTADGTTLAGPSLNGNFCTLAAGCPLPSPCTYAGPGLGQLAPGDAVLAANGGTLGSRVRVTGMSVEAFCQLETAPSPTPLPVALTPAPVASDKSGNCPVSKSSTAGPDVYAPGLCVAGVQGNAVVEAAGHPPDVATALLAMALQNAGATPTDCAHVSAGSPVPLLGPVAQPPRGVTSLAGYLGYAACLYRPAVDDGFGADSIGVVWFSSEGQAEQAYQTLSAALPPAP